MLQAAPSAIDERWQDLAEHDTGLGPEPPIVCQRPRTRPVADHEPAKAGIAHQDVRAEPEHEPGEVQGLGGCHSASEIVGRSGNIQGVGRTADAEGGVRSQGLVFGEALVHESRPERGADGRSDHGAHV